MTDLCDKVALRPVGPGDEPFLLEVYAGTRAAELDLTPWNAEQRLSFVQAQFAARQQHYRSYYPDAAHDIILLQGRPVGCLYVARGPEDIRVLDLTILPGHQKAGIGTHLLQQVMAEAASAGKTVSLHVESFNPALPLFARLGFYTKEDKGVYILFEWRPKKTM